MKKEINDSEMHKMDKNGQLLNTSLYLILNLGFKQQHKSDCFDSLLLMLFSDARDEGKSETPINEESACWANEMSALILFSDKEYTSIYKKTYP